MHDAVFRLQTSLFRWWKIHLCEGEIKESQLLVVDDMSIPLELCVPDCVEGVGRGIFRLWLLGCVPHHFALIMGSMDGHL